MPAAQALAKMEVHVHWLLVGSHAHAQLDGPDQLVKHVSLWERWFLILGITEREDF